MISELKETTETKNVIILWNYLNWGGAQIYLLSIVKHAPENWKFKIVIPRKSPADIVELFKKHGAEIEYQDVWLDTGQAKTIVQKIKRQWRRIHSEIVTYKYIRRQNLKNTVLHIETAPWQSWILIRKLSALDGCFYHDAQFTADRFKFTSENLEVQTSISFKIKKFSFIYIQSRYKKQSERLGF